MASDTPFTADTFPNAIASLFQMNNYDVQANVHIHGAQIDLLAHSKSDQFAPTIYIEATIEFVGTAKYGKDATKFMLVRTKDPSCVCICVSNVGFTAEVKERASASGVRTITYSDLFRSFEKFGAYVDHILEDESIKEFEAMYEEPLFADAKGQHPATNWLSNWRISDAPDMRWLIVLGEYGTGKTSLTRILQYRWLRDYKDNAAQPIPFRIELRNFTRQFDARTLIHHFLDHNRLGHVPIEFAFHLMRRGRVLLLLDGYDEMAQFLNARERRDCLAALADLANEGARGLLTSRPNYFSETEELRVFEALYDTLRENRYFLGRADRSYLESEQRLDTLVEKYLLNRYERHIRHLTPEQTEALVRRKLAADPQGQEIVLGLLQQVFRAEASGARQALSGKPVIITYLLELIDELRDRQLSEKPFATGELTEWQIYRIIVDRLMLRDFQRSPLSPQVRRTFLQSLAIALSGRDASLAQAGIFYEIINRVFRNEFRFMEAEERGKRREELFEDLRTSATLTRSEASAGSGWQFSHNSLREYLVAEHLVGSVQSRAPAPIAIPISSAMRAFTASLPEDELRELISTLWELWNLRSGRRDMGSYVTLLWDGLSKLHQKSRTPGLIGIPLGIPVPFDGIKIAEVDFETGISRESPIAINGRDSEFSEVSFRGLDLCDSDFSGAILDSVLFQGAKLKRVRFVNALLFECDLTDAEVAGGDFTGLDTDSSLIVLNRGLPLQRMSGPSAIGYLAYHGAVTDPIGDFYRWQHHPKFSIVFKICERIMGQRNSQLRGLTQRGEAHQDPPFARAFVQHLKQQELITIHHQLVSATPEGRQVIPDLVEHERMPRAIAEFFESNS